MKAFVLFIFLGLTVNLFSQFVNVNPDPNGDPWMVFFGEDSLCFDPDFCLDYQPLILTNNSENKSLPYKVDNSEKKFSEKYFIKVRLFVLQPPK